MHCLVKQQFASDLPMFASLIRVLAYPKFKLTPTEQEDLLSDYILFCEAVAMPDRLPVIPEYRDPFDVPFLRMAVVSEADYLVTGNRDLLSLSCCRIDLGLS